MFDPVDTSVRFPALEAEISRFWKERAIYEKSLARRAGAQRFVFYEGPPTANGLPHPGHCLTRAIKDLFPRYRTMRGYLCERKAGWDTHGLPVEVEVCKELGIHSKEEIERFGIEPFIHRCLESVFRYTRQWERMTERLGFWIHLDDAYVTYHQSYIESVWWALKNLFDRGLLYQGHKIVWWWAQGGTALSAGEVGQGYREVADPSVYVKFPIVADERAKKLGLDENTSLLVWTTTPWTLPSNQFAAVHPELEYAIVTVNLAPGEPPGVNEVANTTQRLLIAAALVETIAGKAKRELMVERTIKGVDLLRLRYMPPFEAYYNFLQKSEPQLPGIGQAKPKWGSASAPLREGGNEYLAWRVVGGEFVSTDSGTGVVHIAPAFGEIDFELLLREKNRFKEHFGPQLFASVEPDGKFNQVYPQFAGMWVKDADKPITRDLRDRGLLFHQEQYLHEYPFCWRAEEDPLIEYPRQSWFIRTTQFKDKMLANNQQINWLPEHIRDGRFGNFLESNVDWALSRERYWGTPLPIWECEETGKFEAIASYDELVRKPGVSGLDAWDKAKAANPELSEHLKVHKPYIDAVTYDSPFSPGARMRRVPEVIDCWFDSGAMPFAQWGYPRTGHQQFGEQFPADFISEAIDQTRGWFYSQLAISTLLFGEGRGARGEGSEQKSPPSDSHPLPLAPHPYPHPFRNCIVLGLMLGEDGAKMSKSKRNYREPDEIFDRYGADALRWYFFANQPPWTSIRYNEQAIKDSIPEFLLRLWNVYSFFVIYARIDGFDPARDCPSRGELTPSELVTAKSYHPIAQRSELDRWIMAELNCTAAAVTERMDAYDNFAACKELSAFVDALSNWYVRRSRERFWSGEPLEKKLDAYWTLYECLLTTTKLVAPFVPFLAEAMWQNLAVAEFGERVLESVHLCDYPTGDAQAADRELSERMNLVREIVSLGRSARMGAKLKVRQPLAKVEVILADRRHQPWLEEHAALIAEELNVKQVEFTEQADRYITYSVLPDLKRLGPRLGKRLPALKAALAKADAGKILARLETDKKVSLDLPDGPVELDSDDLQVRLQAKEGWAAAQGPDCVVVLATELTAELVTEGWAREIVHAVQTRRKETGCEYTDRIEIGLETDDPELSAAIERFVDYIQQETLGVRIVRGPLPGVEPVELTWGGKSLKLYLKVVPK